MAREDARRFLEALETDQRLAEKVRESLSAERAPLDAYASAAKDFGYAFSAEDLAAELEAQATRISDAEVSDEELEQVAGGLDDDFCAETYDPKENCLINDRCGRVTNSYPENEDCYSSFRYYETCLINDRCLSVLHHYN